MSNGLTARELAQMQADIDDLFPDTCNILAATLVSDGAGGNTETWGTVTADVPCRVDYRVGREAVINNRLASYQSATISLAFDVTITPLNRIEVGSDVFTVQAVNRAQSWRAVTRCTAELIP